LVADEGDETVLRQEAEGVRQRRLKVPPLLFLHAPSPDARPEGKVQVPGRKKTVV
jgi:hypothetical protein